MMMNETTNPNQRHPRDLTPDEYLVAVHELRCYDRETRSPATKLIAHYTDGVLTLEELILALQILHTAYWPSSPIDPDDALDAELTRRSEDATNAHFDNRS